VDGQNDQIHRPDSLPKRSPTYVKTVKNIEGDILGGRGTGLKNPGSYITVCTTLSEFPRICGEGLTWETGHVGTDDAK
jgi:hypothetical protein